MTQNLPALPKLTLLTRVGVASSITCTQSIRTGEFGLQVRLPSIHFKVASTVTGVAGATWKASAEPAAVPYLAGHRFEKVVYCLSGLTLQTRLGLNPLGNLIRGGETHYRIEIPAAVKISLDQD